MTTSLEWFFGNTQSRRPEARSVPGNGYGHTLGLEPD